MIDLLAERDFDAAVIFTVYSQNPLPAALLCHSSPTSRCASRTAARTPISCSPTGSPEPEPERDGAPRGAPPARPGDECRMRRRRTSAARCACRASRAASACCAAARSASAPTRGVALGRGAPGRHGVVAPLSAGVVRGSRRAARARERLRQIVLHGTAQENASW